jgi:hypothetical protein
MTLQPCGFKGHHAICLQQELRKPKRPQERIGTPASASAIRIKPPEIAVAVCTVLGLFGGRSPATPTNEHRTTNGGRTDA